MSSANGYEIQQRRFTIISKVTRLQEELRREELSLVRRYRYLMTRANEVLRDCNEVQQMTHHFLTKNALGSIFVGGVPQTDFTIHKHDAYSRPAVENVDRIGVRTTSKENRIDPINEDTRYILPANPPETLKLKNPNNELNILESLQRQGTNSINSNLSKNKTVEEINTSKINHSFTSEHFSPRQIPVPSDQGFLPPEQSEMSDLRNNNNLVTVDQKQLIYSATPIEKINSTNETHGGQTVSKSQRDILSDSHDERKNKTPFQEPKINTHEAGKHLRKTSSAQEEESCPGQIEEQPQADSCSDYNHEIKDVPPKIKDDPHFSPPKENISKQFWHSTNSSKSHEDIKSTIKSPRENRSLTVHRKNSDTSSGSENRGQASTRGNQMSKPDEYSVQKPSPERESVLSEFSEDSDFQQRINGDDEDIFGFTTGTQKLNLKLLQETQSHKEENEYSSEDDSLEAALKKHLSNSTDTTKQLQDKMDEQESERSIQEWEESGSESKNLSHHKTSTKVASRRNNPATMDKEKASQKGKPINKLRRVSEAFKIDSESEGELSAPHEQVDSDEEFFG